MLFFFCGIIVGILIGVNIYYVYKQDRLYRSVRDADIGYLFILKDNQFGMLDGYHYDEIKKEIVFEIQDESTGEMIHAHLEDIAHVVPVNHNDDKIGKSKQKEEKEENELTDENFMYLHCDEWKSHGSMNPCYDSCIYRKRAGRRAMWRRIKEDVEQNVIQIPEHRIEKVRYMILQGDPCDANDYMTYAYILRLEEAV